MVVSRRPLTAEAWFDSRSVHVRFVVDIVTGFSPSTSVSFVSIIPLVLHTQLHLHVVLTRRTDWANSGNLPTSNSRS